MDDNHSYGCLMAVVPREHAAHIIKFGKTVVPDSILYSPPNDNSYGYEKKPHVTIKYGYSPDLTRNDIGRILTGLKPFTVRLYSISQFNNPEFDVIKFDVESPVLRQLRTRADQYPNFDTYKEYHPHMTLAYVKPSMFKKIKSNLIIDVPITQIEYSGQKSKILINL